MTNVRRFVAAVILTAVATTGLNAQAKRQMTRADVQTLIKELDGHRTSARAIPCGDGVNSRQVSIDQQLDRLDASRKATARFPRHIADSRFLRSVHQAAQTCFR